MLHCVALLMRCHTHNYVELNFPSFYFTKIQIGSTLDRTLDRQNTQYSENEKKPDIIIMEFFLSKQKYFQHHSI